MNEPPTEKLALDAELEDMVLEQADAPKAEESATDDATTAGDDPLTAAGSAIPLAKSWMDNACELLRVARIAASDPASKNAWPGIALGILRRHFHTDRIGSPMTEAQAIDSLSRRFGEMRTLLSHSATIFQSADDETAAQNTRGVFGTDVTVAAFAFPRRSISFTTQFPSLGPNCRAAVIIHQLAHYVDARNRDYYGTRGVGYDNADFNSAFQNVHCYPNLAINATAPFSDERYGMARPAD